MSGDTANPRIWINADVYVADQGTDGPETVHDAWPAGFDALGLLGEDGMTEQRDEDTTDHFAWGGINVRTTRSKHKRTITVVALEDNAFVFDLVNPGSEIDTSGGVVTRTHKIPHPERKTFGIETIDGDIIRRIIIPDGEAVLSGEVKSADDEMTLRELTITVYPDADEVLYTEITNDPAAGGSGS